MAVSEDLVQQLLAKSQRPAQLADHEETYRELSGRGLNSHSVWQVMVKSGLIKICYQSFRVYVVRHGWDKRRWHRRAKSSPPVKLVRKGSQTLGNELQPSTVSSPGAGPNTDNRSEAEVAPVANNTSTPKPSGVVREVAGKSVIMPSEEQKKIWEAEEARLREEREREEEAEAARERAAALARPVVTGVVTEEDERRHKERLRRLAGLAPLGGEATAPKRVS